MATPLYLSLVVRVWREPRDGWHSEIEEIQSGKRWTFKNLPESLDFLRRHLEAADLATVLMQDNLE